MFAKKLFAGLDIGSNSIKLSLIQKQVKSYQLAHLVEIPLSDGVVQEGVIRDGSAVTDILKDLCRRFQLQKYHLIGMLAGQQVMIRQLRMPVMPDKELAEAVRWEGEKYIPLPMNDLVIDYVNYGVQEQNQLQIVLVAVPKKVVYEYCSVVADAGIKMRALDIQPFALWRFFRDQLPDQLGDAQTEAVGLIDIGRETTNFAVFQRGQLKFTRTIPVAGKQIDEVLSEGFNLEPEVARKLKEEGGRASSSEDTELSQEDIVSAVSGVLTGLVSEVRRSIDYFVLQTRGIEQVNINKLFLSGGTARLAGITDVFAGELGLPTMTTSFSHEQDKQLIDPLFASALGLALWEVDK